MSDIETLFCEYDDRKTAIYGLGAETEKVLPALKAVLQVVGLLDGFREDGLCYGERVISLRDAVDYGVTLIIVVARPGSCKAIAKKIGEICRDHEIILLDIRGKNLLAASPVSFQFKHISGGTQADLYEKINRAEIISFDFFDTLVMRRVLSYTDIFELLELLLSKNGVYLPDFAQKRLYAEKKLAIYGAPSLREIYREVLAKCEGTTDIRPEELAEREWLLDLQLIVPRKDVCQLFRKAVAEGKKVYIVTDTYYGRRNIERLLDLFDLGGYEDIFTSCEYGTGKRQKLFDIFINEVGRGAYLHIGDDVCSDVEAATAHGMNAFHIYNGADLFHEAGEFGMSDAIERLPSRLKAGLFVSRLFNSPFQFETEERRIQVADCYDIGYLFLAPVITDFTLWFYDKVTEKQFQNVWLCARDGFLIQKMLHELDPNLSTEYFLTSRSAAVRAGVNNREDILDVQNMNFFGSTEEELRVRFGLNAETAMISHEGETGLLRFQASILKNAKKHRANYRKYLGTINIADGDIAFFDFVAKGTAQMYLQRLVSNCLKGFYFLRMEPDHMAGRNLDIHSFYSAEEAHNSVIYDDYYILETVLTAPHPCLCEFDRFGNPVFAKETRTDRAIRCFQRVQEGILDYFKDYLRLVPREYRHENKMLDGILLALIHRIKIEDDDFLSLVVEDPFFHRVTDLKDLM